MCGLYITHFASTQKGLHAKTNGTWNICVIRSSDAVEVQPDVGLVTAGHDELGVARPLHAEDALHALGVVDLSIANGMKDGQHRTLSKRQ